MVPRIFGALRIARRRRCRGAPCVSPALAGLILMDGCCHLLLFLCRRPPLTAIYRSLKSMRWSIAGIAHFLRFERSFAGRYWYFRFVATALDSMARFRCPMVTDAWPIIFCHRPAVIRMICRPIVACGRSSICAAHSVDFRTGSVRRRTNY